MSSAVVEVRVAATVELWSWKWVDMVERLRWTEGERCEILVGVFLFLFFCMIER